jgi:hypothetical protein
VTSESPEPAESVEPAEPTEVAESAEPAEPTEVAEPAQPAEPRSLIERIGLAAVAFGLAVMFGGVGYAAWLGGELFLAVIGAISCAMTVWVGMLTLLRS